jgi:hypothetical protein
MFSCQKTADKNCHSKVLPSPLAPSWITYCCRLCALSRLAKWFACSWPPLIYVRVKQPVTGLEWPRGFQEVKVPRLHDNGTGWWRGFQPHAPATFTPRKYSWYSFLLEAESTPGP